MSFCKISKFLSENHECKYHFDVIDINSVHQSLLFLSFQSENMEFLALSHRQGIYT